MRGLSAVRAGVVALAVMALTGCGPKELSKPPAIHYGTDACAQCRMIIQDERFASASVSAEGRFQKFDDIGCLAAYERAQTQPDARVWVHDMKSGAWIAAETAVFVHARELVTPMGYGLAAFAAEQDAAQWARDKSGQVIHWNEINKEEVK